MIQIEITYHIFLGVLGGFTNTVMHSDKLENLTKYDSIKRIVLGAIIGGLYYILIRDYSYPNLVMTFVAGYTGIDFIQQLIDRFREDKEDDK